MSATKRKFAMEHSTHSNDFEDSSLSRKVRKLDVTEKNSAILLFPGESAASPLDWCEFKDIVILAGDTAEDDLASQLSSVFAQLPPQNLTLEKDKVLFVRPSRTEEDELNPIVEQIFDALHDLYTKWKARSFLLLDVPPLARFPGGKKIEFDNERCLTWNTELVEQAKAFAESASKASISVVSSHAVISQMLDDPERYGLSDSVEKDVDENVDEDDEDDEYKDDSDQEPKAMWEDELHLSYAGHEKFAERLWHIFGSVRL
ncbi:hypothetical protein H0H93_008565 [Arthromyces matolae]|nr:hypothetical protein H0H93_008565 [Arthromyces matolae]